MPLDRGFDSPSYSYHKVDLNNISLDKTVPPGTSSEQLRAVDLGYVPLPMVGVNGGSRYETTTSVQLTSRLLIPRGITGFFLKDRDDLEGIVPVEDKTSIIFNEQKGTITIDPGSPEPVSELDPRKFNASGFVF